MKTLSKSTRVNTFQLDGVKPIDPAEFFAVLASVADLSSLEQWQKEKLVSDARRVDRVGAMMVDLASLPTPGATVGKLALNERSLRLSRARKDKKFVKSWRGGEIPYEWLAIWGVHPFANSIINQLVNRGGADLRGFSEKRLKPISIQINGVMAYDGMDVALDGLFEILWKVITAPSSFLRCGFCKTIFVPASKKQKKFCGKECGNKAVSLTPKRQQYMKKFMVTSRLANKIAGLHDAIKKAEQHKPKIDAAEINQLKTELEQLKTRYEELANGNQ